MLARGDGWAVPLDYVLTQKLLAAVLIGYLLGAIPFALIAGRIRGVDIFATGNKLSGTANVFWNIGHRTGALVFVGDLAKGASAVVIAQILEVPDTLILLVAGAAILGHWKSVFARFRGGDGMAPLMGLNLALVPTLAPLGIVTGLAVILILRRSIWRSSWGVATCFIVMLALSLPYDVDRGLVVGLSGLAGMVLVRSTLARRLRGQVPAEDEIVLDLELEEETELGPPAPENR